MKSKSLVLMSALLFILQNVVAQSFTLQTLSGITVNNGDTIIISGTTNDFLLEGRVAVVNISNATKSVQVKKENNLIAGTESTFTWGLIMYAPSIMQSAIAVDINAGVINNSFYGDYVTYSIPGVSFARYTFFDDNNIADSAWMVFEYNVSLVSAISNPAEDKFNIYPNPGNGIFNVSSFNCFTNTMYQVYDATGKIIFSKKQSVNNSNCIIDLSAHQNGIYYLQFMNEKTGYYKYFQLIKNE